MEMDNAVVIPCLGRLTGMFTFFKVNKVRPDRSWAHTVARIGSVVVQVAVARRRRPAQALGVAVDHAVEVLRAAEVLCRDRALLKLF